MASPEEKAVSRAVESLRAARRVLQRYHEEEGSSFQEEPSLTDVLLVAQLLGQSSAMENLGSLGRSIEEGSLGSGGVKRAAQPPTLPPDAMGAAEGVGAAAYPATFPETELMVTWDSAYRGWHVLVRPEISGPVYCSTPQQLSDAIRDLQARVIQFRVSNF